MGLSKWNLNANSSPEACVCFTLHLFDKKLLVFTNQVVKYFCQMITLSADEDTVKYFFLFNLYWYKVYEKQFGKIIKTPEMFVQSDPVIKVVLFEGESAMHLRMGPRTCSYPYHSNTAESWNVLNVPQWQYGDKHYGSFIGYVKIKKKKIRTSRKSE